MLINYTIPIIFAKFVRKILLYKDSKYIGNNDTDIYMRVFKNRHGIYFDNIFF